VSEGEKLHTADERILSPVDFIWDPEAIWDAEIDGYEFSMEASYS
jgi:hypothetical protein